MDSIYSPDQPRRTDWTLVGFLNTPYGKCNVWIHADTPDQLTVSVPDAPPWDPDTDNEGMSHPAWMILIMPGFEALDSVLDPDPADWGFESNEEEPTEYS